MPRRLARFFAQCTRLRAVRRCSVLMPCRILRTKLKARSTSCGTGLCRSLTSLSILRFLPATIFAIYLRRILCRLNCKRCLIKSYRIFSAMCSRTKMTEIPKNRLNRKAPKRSLWSRRERKIRGELCSDRLRKLCETVRARRC